MREPGLCPVLPPTPSRPTDGGPDPIRIIIRPGETILDVQRKTGIGLAELFAANPQLRSAQALRPGQLLCLPRGAPEPLEDRARRLAPHRQPAPLLDANSRKLQHQSTSPLRSSPYDDTAATSRLVAQSVGGALGAGLAPHDASPAEQRRLAELGQGVQALATAGLGMAAAHRQARRAYETQEAWEGRPVRGHRQDNDFGKHVVTKSTPRTGETQRSYKTFITDKGNLRSSNPDGRTTVLQHVAGREPSKSDSPYISIKVEGRSGKYFGGKGIEIDLDGLRRDIASGRVQGVKLIEHRELMAAHHRNIDARRLDLAERPSRKTQEALEHAQSIASYSRRDKEALIEGTLPRKYFRTVGPSRAVESVPTAYERRLADAPAQRTAR